MRDVDLSLSDKQNIRAMFELVKNNYLTAKHIFESSKGSLKDACEEDTTIKRIYPIVDYVINNDYDYKSLVEISNKLDCQVKVIFDKTFNITKINEDLSSRVKSFHILAEKIYSDILDLADLYDLYSEVYEAMHWKLAHIVWEDGNYLRGDIESCIEDCKQNRDNVDEVVVSFVLLSLQLLKRLPEFTQEMSDL